MTGLNEIDTHGPVGLRYARSGFTLVDIMIVVILMGIIIAITVPTFDSAVADAKLKAVASEIITAFEYAQSINMNTGVWTVFKVLPATDEIIVKKDDIGISLITDLNSEIDEAVLESGSYTTVPHPLKKGSDYRIKLADEGWFGGVDITKVNLDPKNNVVFREMGTPNIDGDITIKYGKREIILIVDSKKRTIRIQ
jgi:type II secretory pathway pseudopilin PulG